MHRRKYRKQISPSTYVRCKHYQSTLPVNDGANVSIFSFLPVVVVILGALIGWLAGLVNYIVDDVCMYLVTSTSTYPSTSIRAAAATLNMIVDIHHTQGAVTKHPFQTPSTTSIREVVIWGGGTLIYNDIGTLNHMQSYITSGKWLGCHNIWIWSCCIRKRNQHNHQPISSLDGNPSPALCA